MNRTAFKINIGPQHPLTHGALRLITELDGELIKSVEPVIGYLHRGLEKIAEDRTYLEYLPITDKIDCISGVFYQEAFCSAVENLCGIEVPERAKHIRVMIMELNRISSHLMWLGTYLKDLGAVSLISFAIKERENILRIFEGINGQRIMLNYHKFGGVKHDLDENTISSIDIFLKKLPEKLNKFEKILNDNPIFTARTMGIGILSKNTALNYSITGANLRASGISADVRKNQPYLVYDKLEFGIPIQKDGDCFARYMQRMAEIRESAKIISQCLDYLKTEKGEINNSELNVTDIKPKEGIAISYTEAPKGLTSCTLISDGSSIPYRVKWRTGSFYSVQLLPALLKGRYLADIAAILGSLDISMSEVDR